MEEVEARGRERLAVEAGVRTAAEAESTRLREQVAALEKEVAAVQLQLQLADSTHKADLEKAGVQKDAELRQAVELAEQHEAQVIMGLERYPCVIPVSVGAHRYLRGGRRPRRTGRLWPAQRFRPRGCGRRRPRAGKRPRGATRLRRKRGWPRTSGWTPWRCSSACARPRLRSSSSGC